MDKLLPKEAIMNALQLMHWQDLCTVLYFILYTTFFYSQLVYMESFPHISPADKTEADKVTVLPL